MQGKGFRALAACALLCVLAACGGGGGGDSGNSGENPPSHATATALLTPSSLSGDFIAGRVETYPVSISITLSEGVSSLTLVFASMPSVLEAAPTIVGQPEPLVYNVAFKTSSGASAGHYTGTINVRICDTAQCSIEYGHAALPYDFNVSNPTDNQPPLTNLPGAADWQTENGNIQQNAFVPVTLDPTKFTHRWDLTAKDTAGNPIKIAYRPPVSSAVHHLAYVTYRPTSDTDEAFVYALSESDGSVAWSASLGAPYRYPGAAAIFDDTVYVATAVGGSATADSFVAAYDAGTGVLKFSAKNGVSSPGRIVVEGNIAFVNPGSNTGETPLFALDKNTGALLWSAAAGAGRSRSLAVDGSNAYFYRPSNSQVTAPGLYAVNKSSGATVFSVGVPPEPGSVGIIYNDGLTPVLDGVGGLAVNQAAQNGPSGLLYYDIATQSLRWNVTTSDFAGNPVIVGNTLYTLAKNPNRLEARSISDGSVLWSWSKTALASEYLTSNVIATNNLIFFSTDKQVYAVDLGSKALAWTYPDGGLLSISPSGLLYVAGDSGLTAINLH